MKITFYCLKEYYIYIKEYLDPLVSLLNCELKILESYQNFSLLESNKHIFIKKLPYNISGENIILFNIEQLSRKNFKLKCPPETIVLDYALGNLDFINNEKYCIPYLYNPKEVYNFSKIYDVCFIGGLSPKRKNILTKLKQKGIKVNRIKGWGNDRDQKLFKHKILLNISFDDDYKVFEAIRCNRCVHNKMIVISDFKIDMDKIPLRQHIFFTPYNLLVDTVMYALKNYKEVYEKLTLDNLKLPDPNIPKFLLKQNLPPPHSPHSQTACTQSDQFDA